MLSVLFKCLSQFFNYYNRIVSLRYATLQLLRCRVWAFYWLLPKVSLDIRRGQHVLYKFKDSNWLNMERRGLLNFSVFCGKILSSVAKFCPYKRHPIYSVELNFVLMFTMWTLDVRIWLTFPSIKPLSLNVVLIIILLVAGMMCH